MAMRLSGLMSGMDTESIVQELVAVRQTKVDNLKKEQTKLQWKQDAWKELNNKIKKLYNGTMSNLRFQSSYAKKVTKVSDSSVAEVITSDTAMDSVQSLKVTNLARTGYLTGGAVAKEDGSKCTSATLLKDMGIATGSKIEITTGGKTTEITVSEGMTIGNLTSQLTNAGVKANFDSKTQRLFIGAKESGTKADFAITAANDQGTNALDKLGILVYDKASIAQYQAYADMATNTAAYDAAVDKEVASRLNTYIKKADSLTKSLESLNEKLEKVKADYAEKYNGADDEDFDTTLSKAADLKARRTELEEAAESRDLTDEEREELNQLKEKLSYVESYESIQKSITETQESLAEAQSYFNADDKTASDKLTAEVKAELDAKIAKAQTVIANKDSLKGSKDATRVEGEDALIYLNGAKFESSGNTFEINGLTITCNAETGDREITLTTQNDTSGIYDMIKGFIKEYSTLINEMDKLYNADSAKGYEPLTDDEKAEMSEDEIEKWEEKIKDSLLRRDSTLNTVSSAFKTIMSSGFAVNGKTMYLSDFGINTLGYFEAEDNERNAYHIDGDEDDETVSSKTNTLKAMISSDPDAVTNFFSQLTKSLYEKTSDLMKSVTDYSSSYTVYEDKKMKSDYDDYTKKIAEMEEKLRDYEDKWYKKFSAMETAMAKMQSNANAVTSLLGGS